MTKQNIDPFDMLHPANTSVYVQISQEYLPGTYQSMIEAYNLSDKLQEVNTKSIWFWLGAAKEGSPCEFGCTIVTHKGRNKRVTLNKNTWTYFYLLGPNTWRLYIEDEHNSYQILHYEDGIKELHKVF